MEGRRISSHHTQVVGQYPALIAKFEHTRSYLAFKLGCLVRQIMYDGKPKTSSFLSYIFLKLLTYYGR